MRPARSAVAPLFGLLALGCPRAGPPAYDPSLPESPAPASAPDDPRAILDAGAGTLDVGDRAVALAHIVSFDWGPQWDARALEDPSPWVQRRVVTALAERGGADDLLVTFAARESRAPMARALAALRVRTPEMTEAIAGSWTSEPPWRRAPLALAALVHGEEAALGGLASALRSGELPLDVELMYEIGRSGDHRLTAPLREAQEAVEEELSLAVAAARLQLGDDTAEEPFRKALSSPDVVERMEAVDHLVELDHDRVRGLLVKARSGGPDVVRWYADLALAATSGSDPGVFERAMASGDGEVRALAVRFASEAVAGASPHRRVVRAAKDVIVQALSDDEPWVQAAGLRAVRERGMTEAIEAAARWTASPHGRVRILAAAAVLALRPPEGREAP